MPVGSAKRQVAETVGAAGAPDDPPRDVTEDNAVLAAARSGDRAAVARLYAAHAPMVHAVLLARVGREEAEDLVQDVFLRAITKLRSLKHGEGLGPWLASIARNLAADAGRARVRAGRLRLAMSEVAAPARESAATGIGVDEALAAVRALPEAYRETLMLRLVERLTGPQIAERLGLTHGSVRVNLCRGMKLLRERLGPGPPLDGET